MKPPWEYNCTKQLYAGRFILMRKITIMFKSLGYAYLLTIILIVIYNTLLTYTPMNSSSIPIATSVITTCGAVCAGFYMSLKTCSRGLLYGCLAGGLYVLVMMVTMFLIQDNMEFQMRVVYKALLNVMAGGIGGIIGVNAK